MRLHIFLTASTGLLLLVACSETPLPFEPQELPVPAQVPATGPRISGDSESGLILSWMEHDEDEAALLYSTFENGGWTSATTVVDGVDMFVNWADMPSVQPMGSGRLAAHWLEMSADTTYAYDVVYVQSSDAGATWSEPLRPHADGTPTEHGFVSMFRMDGHTGLIWLDGRKMMNEVTDDPVASGMTLRAALIDANQSVRNEQLVDELICDCCQTDIAVATSGPVAVYRDRSIDEIRDISITRFVDGRWQAGQPVTNDNWKIPGCPVNGPSIIADGDFVAVASFTGADGRPVVNLTTSNDSGASFDTPIEVIDGKVLGRVGLVHLGNGDVAVSWLQSGAQGSNEVRVRKVGADGALGEIRTVARGAGSFSVPQMALYGDDLIFVWTESEDFVNQVKSANAAATAL